MSEGETEKIAPVSGVLVTGYTKVRMAYYMQAKVYSILMCGYVRIYSHTSIIINSRDNVC